MYKKTWRDCIIEQVEVLKKQCFNLKEFYVVAKAALQKQYPKNNTVQDKIRQQLQLLRNDGYLNFIDNDGHYEVTKKFTDSFYK